MRLCFFVICCFFFACKPVENTTANTDELNSLAEDYVRLGLAIGSYDTDFVDAYYGPDSLKSTTTKAATFPKDSFLTATNTLQQRINSFITSTDSAASKRAKWISSQLTAFQRRIKMFSGEFASFDEEAKDLFGIQPPTFTEDHFNALLKEMEALLPGSGSVDERFQQLANRFAIPKDKTDTLYKVTIAESRKRTMQHYSLPANENFKLEFVNNKPWSGYNWYKGNYQSVIQFNTDITAFIESAIDIASHEGYPGHHVFNALLEKNLYRDNGQVEISLYPLYSPQSLLAEGTANYGIEVVFPGEEKIRFAKDVLLPLAGLDTTGLSHYFRALAIKGKLTFIRTEVTRRLLNGKMTDEEAINWLMKYGMMNKNNATRSIAFSRNYRSYVINYTTGQQLVKDYINSKGGDSDLNKRWELFYGLLTTQIVPTDLK
jgi:hypothetical protein